MSHSLLPVRRWFGAAVVAAAFCGAAGAADVELLPGGLLTPTTKEQTQPGQFKKPGPWRIGVSFGGVGNTWIVQMIQEMRHAAAQDKNIGEFIFVEANWQAAKQVADVEDLLTKKVDVLIIGPISSAIGAPLVEKAAKTGIPVVVFGAFGKAMPSTVEMMGAGEVFGRQGGEFLRKELNGKGNLWAFRGVAGVEEETLRYNGFRKSIEGSAMKVTKEVFGDWNYAKSKQLCENLVLSGDAVDGIWFSGAEMTRACIDVFKETGKPLVPMTGEGNNGFLRTWKATGVKSVAPQFTPGLGAAVVRASAALLAGKPLYRAYFSSPPPITQADLDKFYRPDLNDAYWLPSTLPEAKLKDMFRR
ncbi:ABC transporter substrate-binding protein [Hydrogenophaga sp.]|uniref:ABC transporter substrate-binding protein n=1 Tax=Hydrogenophaga sp. TaxID=1904254 RepID=UPI00260B311F|nr:ABC transporter substrate-binding protein [Hydrogenophaga sp.]MCW5652825.1 ABC transporter substrate-binding protein [Hydrogenophaga sp.]